MQPPASRTAFALLEEQARRAPDHTLAVTVDDRVTYGDLLTVARRVAHRLRQAGIGSGDRVGLLCNNRIEWLEVFFAAAALGATLVPFSTWSKPAELDFLLKDSGVRILFTLDSYGGQPFAADIGALRASGEHPGLERVVVIDAAHAIAGESYAAWRSDAGPSTLPPGGLARPEDPLVLLYTSGSSNRPKAVPLLNGSAVENGFNIGERMGLTGADRVLVAVPLFWSYGAVNALPATVTHGGTLVLQGRFEPAGALDLIERERCTALYTLPAMTSALLAHPSFRRERTASLRTGLTIGSPQDVIRAAEDLGAREICNIYGSTESYGNCAVAWHHWPLAERSASQGPPLPGVTFRIRDAETGRLLGPDETGEVEVKGHLTPGYAGDSARHNGEVFLPDGFFRTGDLGRLTTDGRFVFAGRSSEMIKRSGINVSPAEVEEVLQQHAGVALAGVTGLPDPVKGELIVAYVIPRADAVVDAAALTAHCRQRLSGYKIPDTIRLAASLPQTPTGKLMRRELKALAAAQSEGDV